MSEQPPPTINYVRAARRADASDNGALALISLAFNGVTGIWIVGAVTGVWAKLFPFANGHAGLIVGISSLVAMGCGGTAAFQSARDTRSFQLGWLGYSLGMLGAVIAATLIYLPH